MTFYQNVVVTKVCISLGSSFLLTSRINNDSMYVRFDEMRNTKTWSKSILQAVKQDTITGFRFDLFTSELSSLVSTLAGTKSFENSVFIIRLISF